MSNFNFNKVILGGRLASDVYMAQTMGGHPICDFSLEVKSNERGCKEKPDIIKCTALKKTAELIHTNFEEGSPICIVGKLRAESYEDSDGYMRYTYEVVVDEVVFVDKKQTKKALK